MIFKIIFLILYTLFSISFAYELKKYPSTKNEKIICGVLFFSLSIFVLHILNIRSLLL